MQRHTGEKYFLEICGSVTAGKPSFRKYIEAKPFIFEVCKIVFPRSSSFKRYSSTHFITAAVFIWSQFLITHPDRCFDNEIISFKIDESFLLWPLQDTKTNYFLKGHMSMLTEEKSLISISKKLTFENPHCRKNIFLNSVDQRLHENHIRKFFDWQFLLSHIEAKPFIHEVCKTA